MLSSPLPAAPYTAGEAARIPWRQVAAAITDLLMVVDAAGHTVFFNEPLETALARPLRPDLDMDAHAAAYGLYRSDGTLLPLDEWPLYRALHEGRVMGEVEVIFRRPDGAQRITRWSAAPLRDDSGAIVGAVGTGRDVTEQAQARAWLQASERGALLLAELGSHFAASLELAEVLERVVRTTGAHLGDWCTIHLVDPANPTHLRLAANYHSDPARAQSLQQLRTQQPLSTQDGVIGQVFNTGEPLWLHQITPDLLQVVTSAAERAALELLQPSAALLLPLRGRQGLLGILTIALAGPGRRRTFSDDDYALAQEVAGRAALAIENAQLYERTRSLLSELEQSNRLKDEFISIASHELRTPLTAVRGYAEILLRRVRGQPGREADVRALETIHDQVDRMNRLITDLLDVSHLSSQGVELRPQQLDLAALVGRMVEQQQPLAPHHALTVVSNPPEIIGTWDGVRLEQVLLNLLNNAVKYSPDGGPVVVTVHGDAAQERVTLVVQDSGIGIPAASLPYLFTRFYRAPNAGQARSGGLGIGLYISRQIVRAHGGDITVASTPDAGTTLTVTLPWSPPG